MNSTKPLLAALLVLLLPLLLAGAVLAADLLPADLPISDGFAPGYGEAVGKVLMVQGRAAVIHDDGQQGYWLKPEMSLYKNDTLVTLEGGRLRYTMNDGSVMTMASETRLVLSRAVLDPETRTSFTKLDEGKARFYVKKLAKLKKSEFKVKTPTAVVGVRGSDFILVASATATQVTTLDDTLLEVVSLAGLDEPPTLLQSFQRTAVESGRLPSEVERIDPAEIEQLEMEFSGFEGAAGSEGEVEPAVATGEAAPEAAPDIVPAELQILVPEEELVLPESGDLPQPGGVQDGGGRAVEIASNPDAGKGEISGGRTNTPQGVSVALDGGTSQGGVIEVFEIPPPPPTVTELPQFPGTPSGRPAGRPPLKFCGLGTSFQKELPGSKPIAVSFFGFFRSTNREKNNECPGDPPD